MVRPIIDRVDPTPGTPFLRSDCDGTCEVDGLQSSHHHHHGHGHSHAATRRSTRSMTPTIHTLHAVHNVVSSSSTSTTTNKMMPPPDMTPIRRRRGSVQPPSLPYPSVTQEQERSDYGRPSSRASNASSVSLSNRDMRAVKKALDIDSPKRTNYTYAYSTTYQADLASTDELPKLSRNGLHSPGKMTVYTGRYSQWWIRRVFGRLFGGGNGQSASVGSVSKNSQGSSVSNGSGRHVSFDDELHLDHGVTEASDLQKLSQLQGSLAAGRSWSAPLRATGRMVLWPVYMVYAMTCFLARSAHASGAWIVSRVTSSESTEYNQESEETSNGLRRSGRSTKTTHMMEEQENEQNEMLQLENTVRRGTMFWCCCVLPLILLLLALAMLAAAVKLHGQERTATYIKQDLPLLPAYYWSESAKTAGPYWILIGGWLTDRKAQVINNAHWTWAQASSAYESVNLRNSYLAMPSFGGGASSGTELPADWSDRLSQLERRVSQLEAHDYKSTFVTKEYLEKELNSRVFVLLAAARSELDQLKMSGDRLGLDLSAVKGDVDTNAQRLLAVQASMDKVQTELLSKLSALHVQLDASANQHAELQSNTQRTVTDEMRVLLAAVPKVQSELSELSERLVVLQTAKVQMDIQTTDNHQQHTTQSNKLQQQINHIQTDMQKMSALLAILQSQQERDSALLAAADQSAQGTAQTSISGVVDMASIQLMIKAALGLYDADKTGMPDHALESGGGSILSTRCSEDYSPRTRRESVFGFPLWYVNTYPRVVIQRGGLTVQPGDCWAFKGSVGYLVIQLSGHVNVSSFSYEHVQRALLPDQHIDSAPKRMQLFALESLEDASGVELADVEFDAQGPSLQMFPVKRPLDLPPSRIVELRVLSNHGHPTYTCMYRVRVHGQRVWPAYGNTP